MENEVMKTQNATPTRDIQVITAEIKDICRQAHSMALLYAIEIGRRLEEAKLMLPHGQWGEWLKTEVEFSQSTANNYMRLFDEYGAAQISIFGASVNSQTIANLPYTKALQLLAVPKEEREAFAEKVGAEDLSVSELKEAIKERDRAYEERNDAQKREHEMSQKLAAAELEAESAKEKAREAERLLKDAETNAKKAAEAKNKQAIEKAQVAVEEAQRREQEARVAERQAQERLEEAEKKLKTASPEVTAFKALFDQMQGTADKLRSMIGRIRENDPETAEKLKAAMKAFGASL